MDKGYYRTRQRTGGLSGALAPVFQYFAQKREEQKQKDYIKGLLDAFVSTQGKMDDIQNPQIKKELIPQQNDDLQSGQQVDLTRRNALQQTKPQQFSQNTSPETIMSYLRQRNEPTELPIDVQQGDVPAPQEMRGSEQNTQTGVLPEEPQMGEQQIIDEMGKRLDSRTYNVSGNMFPQTKEKLMKKAITDFQVKQLFDAENQKYVNPQQVTGLANVLYSKLPQKPEIQGINRELDYGYFQDGKWNPVLPGQNKGNTELYELENGKPKVYTLENGQKAYKKITTDSRGKTTKEDYEQLQFTPKSAGGSSGSGNGTSGDSGEGVAKEVIQAKAEVEKYIKSVRDFKKKYKWDAKNKTYWTPTDKTQKNEETGKTEFINKGISQKEYDDEKELIKTEGLKYAEQMVEFQGLGGDKGATAKIREKIKLYKDQTGTTPDKSKLEEILNKFMEANKGQYDDKDKEVLRSYFSLENL